MKTITKHLTLMFTFALKTIHKSNGTARFSWSTENECQIEDMCSNRDCGVSLKSSSFMADASKHLGEKNKFSWAQ